MKEFSFETFYTLLNDESILTHLPIVHYILKCKNENLQADKDHLLLATFTSENSVIVHWHRNLPGVPLYEGDIPSKTIVVSFLTMRQYKKLHQHGFPHAYIKN